MLRLLIDPSLLPVDLEVGMVETIAYYKNIATKDAEDILNFFYA